MLAALFLAHTCGMGLFRRVCLLADTAQISGTQVVQVVRTCCCTDRGVGRADPDLRGSLVDRCHGIPPHGHVVARADGILHWASTRPTRWSVLKDIVDGPRQGSPAASIVGAGYADARARMMA
jgi:hypothetical protein